MARLPHADLWLRRMVAALRRGRWAGLIVASIVLLGALAQYAAAMGSVDQVASADLRVVVMPAGAANTSSLLTARSDAEQIALQLSHDNTLTDPALDKAIADAAALPNVTADDVGRTLSAATSGSLVTLTARWPTAAGAEQLARAAVSVLTTRGWADTPAVKPLVPEGALLQTQVSRSPGAARPDASQQEEARRALAARVALSMAAGLLAAAGRASLPAWRSARSTNAGG